MIDRAYPDRPWVGVGCIVFRQGAVLLVQRGKPPRRDEWSLPGGAQKLGETVEEAIRRELREETGIEVGPLALAAVVDAITHDACGRTRYHYTIIDFAAEWLSGEARPGSDVQALAWASADELPRYRLRAEVLQAIAAAQAALAQR